MRIDALLKCLRFHTIPLLIIIIFLYVLLICCLGASKKLGVSAEEVERGVLALAFLLTEAAKFKLAEADLSDSVVSLGLSGEHVATLKSTYGAHVGDLRSMLGRLEFQLPHYVNLDWRLDMEVRREIALINGVKIRLFLFLITIDCNEGFSECG